MNKLPFQPTPGMYYLHFNSFILCWNMKQVNEEEVLDRAFLAAYLYPIRVILLLH